MLRVVRRKSLGVVSLALVAWASGCGDDQGASESKHAHGGSSGASGAATGGSMAGSAGVATGGAGGRAGAGGVTTGGGAGRGGGSGAASGGTAGASGDAGAGGETDGGQGGEAGMGGEGGAAGGEGGAAGMGANAGMSGAGGSGGLSGSGAAGGNGGMAGMSGVGGLGGAGGAGTGGAGAGNAGGGGTGGAGIPGLDVPCQNGPGWTLFRWHYAGTTTPVVDVWDATCSYSASASSTCTIETVGGVSLTQGNTALVIDGSDELRARFSAQGLTFTGAAVYVRARSFSTNASTNIRVASVLHGESVMGPVDQDFTYDWYGMDWTGKVLATDAPGATALRIFPYQGATALAIMSVELCLR